MKTKQPATKGQLGGQPASVDRSHTTTALILGPASAKNSKAGQGKIPSKWAKHNQRLLELRARVEAERNGHALAASQPLESYSMDMADAATDEYDHVIALSEMSAEQDALYEIEEALKRIRNGTYGICQLTGKPIPQKRLDALPWTRFASEAERQLESSGQAHRPRLGELRSVTGPPTGNLEQSEPGEDETVNPACDETLSRAVPNPGLDLSVRRRHKLRGVAVPAANASPRTRYRPGLRSQRARPGK